MAVSVGLRVMPVLPGAPGVSDRAILVHGGCWWC